jgi:non-canonical poly(A) RNA polymerase PAPD5/7
MFQFRGAAARPSGDNYRPDRPDRPGPRRNDFNFSAGNNAPSFAPSNNYPGARRPPPRDSRRNNQRNPRGRGGPRRFGPKPAHERDLMRHQREPTPDQLEGMNDSRESRFKVLDDLSDSDMDDDDSVIELDADGHHPVDASAQPSLSNHASHSDDSEDEHPRAKRARVKSTSPESEQAKPKWSNPDPYTSLPPPGESDAKKKDVVKLIRKAKVEAAKPAATAADGEDFISLNFDDDFAQDDSDNEGGISLSGSVRDEPSLPHKPSFSHLDHLHPDRNLPPPPAVEEPKGVNMSAPVPLPRLDVWPPPADVHGDPSGRSQYHTGLQRQEAKDAVAPLRKDKKRKRRDDVALGDTIEEWRAPEGNDPAPWFANKLQGPRAEQWLHNEILDFYNYVKPRDFEHQVREDLIKRIETAVRRQFPDLNVRAFGSFASGLYLPTADMDLVACSTRFLNGGFANPQPSKSWMYKFANCLKKAGVAIESSVTIIANSRVPLVKFVEKVTGLRVDVSFENDSGLLANNTFQVWKERYPAMPVIVALIKQFLVMRDFSEVFSGGLGGYSVICLTITVLRVLEERNGEDWDPLQNLDTVLMNFFVYYGRDFDVQKHGIQMEPWNIVTKVSTYANVSRKTEGFVCVSRSARSIVVGRWLLPRLIMLLPSSLSIRDLLQ